MSQNALHAGILECILDQFICHFGCIAVASPVLVYGIADFDLSDFIGRAKESSRCDERTRVLRTSVQKGIPSVPPNDVRTTQAQAFEKEFLGPFIVFSRGPALWNFGSQQNAQPLGRNELGSKVVNRGSDENETVRGSFNLRHALEFGFQFCVSVWLPAGVSPGCWSGSMRVYLLTVVDLVVSIDFTLALRSRHQ